MIDLFDMQDNKFIQVSDQVGANILRFNNYANGGRYIPAKDFNRYFDPVEEPEEHAKPEKIEIPEITEEVVNEEPKAEPKKRATRKPKTNQKASK